MMEFGKILGNKKDVKDVAERLSVIASKTLEWAIRINSRNVKLLMAAAGKQTFGGAN